MTGHSSVNGIIAVSFVVGLLVGAIVTFGITAAFGQAYSDGKDCILTSNPPIVGRIGSDGICQPRHSLISNGTTVTATPVPKCPEGYELLMRSPTINGLVCARDIVDPIR